MRNNQSIIAILGGDSKEVTQLSQLARPSIMASRSSPAEAQTFAQLEGRIMSLNNIARKAEGHHATSHKLQEY